MPDTQKERYLFQPANGGYEGIIIERPDHKETFHLLAGSDFPFVTNKSHAELAFLNSAEEALHLLQPTTQRAMEALGLGNFWAQARDDFSRWTIRCLHYPARHIEEKGLLAIPHPDKGGLTIHLTETMGGLEVFVNGHWVDPHSCPQPGKVVAYPGLMAQYHTECLLKASLHQVRALPQIETASRFSVVLFVDFDPSVTYEKGLYGSPQEAFGKGENYDMPFSTFKNYFTVTE